MNLVKYSIPVVVCIILIMVMPLFNLFTTQHYLWLNVGLALTTVLIVVKMGMAYVKKDSQRLPTYHFAKTGVVTVFAHPLRATIFSLVLILPPAFLLYLLLSVGNYIEFGKKLIHNREYAFILIHGIFVLSIGLGIKLFVRRKEIVQLKIDDEGISFLPIKLDSVLNQSDRGIIYMLMKKPMTTIRFSDISRLQIFQSELVGDFIYMDTKSRGEFNLPFVAYDMNHFDAVFNLINSRLSIPSAEEVA